MQLQVTYYSNAMSLRLYLLPFSPSFPLSLYLGFVSSIFSYAPLPFSPLPNLQLHCSHDDYSNEVLLRTLPAAACQMALQTVSPTLSLLSRKSSFKLIAFKSMSCRETRSLVGWDQGGQLLLILVAVNHIPFFGHFQNAIIYRIPSSWSLLHCHFSLICHC